MLVVKIVDLEVADVRFSEENDIGSETRNLLYHNKYLLLEFGNEIVSLEITDVTKTAFYLKIIQD